MSSPVPSVDNYMARDLVTFSPYEDIHKAVRVLLNRRFSGAPVVDDNGRLVGVLSKKDCFKVIYSASYHQDWGGRVGDYMSPEVTTVESGTDIISAADQFMHSRFRRFPVMAHDRMIGLICRHDVLVALEELWSAD